MKTIIIILLVVISHSAFAQTDTFTVKVQRIDTTKKTTWFQRNMPLLVYPAPDSVSKTHSTVTMFFKQMNTVIRLSHEAYIRYMELSNFFVEQRLEMQSHRDTSGWSAEMQEGSPSGH